MTATAYRRGQIVRVELDPAVGREQGKIRPAIVVSNDANNRAAAMHRGTITIVPLTSNVTAVFPFQTLVPFSLSPEHTHSKAQAEQVRTVSIGRIVGGIGWVPTEIMATLDEALRVHLSL